MATNTDDIRSALNNLIETCKDGEEGFRSAAENLKNSSIRSAFQQFSSQRAQFASELQGQVAGIGGQPATSGSATGALHRGWINLKSAITGSDDHAILEEAERGEDSAVKNYREALTKDLPSDLLAMIQRQYRQVQETHNQVRTMRDTGSVGTTTSYTSGTGTTTF